MLGKDENNETVDAPLAVSVAEILLAVLKFSLIYNLSQTAIADLFKMLNTFFGYKMLPDTRYLVDQIFNSTSGIEYHAVCSNCKRYIKQFDRNERQIKCNLCDTDILLTDPTYSDYFVILDVKNEIANLIEDNTKYYEKVQNDTLRDPEIMSDITDGKLYKEFKNSLSADERKNFVTTAFNSDGSPVFKHSKCSLWPIQMTINELPFHVRTMKPIVCGLWFGKDKPDMHTFLKPFVEKMNALANEGVRCKISNVLRMIRVYCLCCCVDSVARAPMQGIVQYNGAYGCSWYLHQGLYVLTRIKGCIKYVLLDEVPENRTQLGTELHMQESIGSPRPVFGVKRPSWLLILIGFGIVDGFVPDSMHCLCLGVAEQFFLYWFGSNDKPYSLSVFEIEQIENMLKGILAPNQIARLSRLLKDRKWWKAREWENWLLFYSIPVLSCFPRMKPYKEHWALVVEAYHILLKSSITKTELDHADHLLKTFVGLTEVHYGQVAMTYNVHQLVHLAQSAAWGPLWAHSGYSFESGNGQLVKKIHAAKGVVHQLARTISMGQSELILKEHISSKRFSTVKRYVAYLDDKFTNSTCRTSHARYFGPNRATQPYLIADL